MFQPLSPLHAGLRYADAAGAATVAPCRPRVTQSATRRAIARTEEPSKNGAPGKLNPRAGSIELANIHENNPGASMPVIPMMLLYAP